MKKEGGGRGGGRTQKKKRRDANMLRKKNRRKRFLPIFYLLLNCCISWNSKNERFWGVELIEEFSWKQKFLCAKFSHTYTCLKPKKFLVTLVKVS